VFDRENNTSELVDGKHDKKMHGQWGESNTTEGKNWVVPGPDNEKGGGLSTFSLPPRGEAAPHFAPAITPQLQVKKVEFISEEKKKYLVPP
jgi:hypothetical protein